MHRLVLLRHGQSSWNLENRFTGWTDVDLTEVGVREARAAGKLFREGRLRVRPRLRIGPAPGHPHGVAGPRRDGSDVAADDVRLAAQRAALRLAPGAGQGRDRRAVRRRRKSSSGVAATTCRRRSSRRTTHATPATTRVTGRLSDGPVAADGEPEGDRRAGAAVVERDAGPGHPARGSACCWRRTATRCGRLVKYLDGVSEKDILELNIPTGIPLVYELDDALKPIRHYYPRRPRSGREGGAGRRGAGQGEVIS